MESVLLSARCTANTATVFWNKPENANQNQKAVSNLSCNLFLNGTGRMTDSLYYKLHKINTIPFMFVSNTG